MTITNELGLPAAIVAAIQNDGYNRGDCDYSITGLLKPVRIAALNRLHAQHLVEDASDRIFSLFGRSIHNILELAECPEYLVEHRFFSDVLCKEPPRSFKVSGKIDLFDRKSACLSDYKICSRYVTGEGVKPDWQAQLSMEAFLMRRNEVEVNSAQIVAIFRDWSKMAAARKHDYPQRQVEVLKVDLWDDAKTEAYILERIVAHEAAKDNIGPVCSSEERWEKPEKFALMKKGRKRAIKLFESEAEAMQAADGVPESFLETRKGENPRCIYYCNVSAYCDFGREQLLASAGE